MRFDVTGMSCAACSARVENAVKKVDGVSEVAVSLLTNKMNVEGDFDPAAVIAAVEQAGYGASAEGAAAAAHEKAKPDVALGLRLGFSIGLLAALMYVSMGHMMWSFPLPVALEAHPVAIALVELCLAALVLVINQRFFVSGFKGALHLAPNMDTLVALGSGAAFMYSLWLTFTMTAQTQAEAMTTLHGLYFESAAMILTLVTVGKALEARAKGRTTDALKKLARLAPSVAVVVRGGTELTVPAAEVRVGDEFVVRTGAAVPVDGVVISGDGAADESALTGESLPVEKAAGSPVSAATMLTAGFVRCRATRVGEDTTFSGIIKLVEGAAATKAPIAKIADRVASVFVPAVLGVALVTLAAWLLAGFGAGFALSRAITVLVISCPCALGLATPVAIMVGSGVGASRGILFKTAQALEIAGRTKIVALDKTGTITEGKPVVTDVIPLGGSESELLSCAYGLEKKSEHPLAKAVVVYAEAAHVSPVETESFRAQPGLGLSAKCEDGVRIFGGNAKMMGALADAAEVKDALARLGGEGKTAMLFAKGDRLLGVIAVADKIKDDSASAIAEFKDMGVRVVMLTGDNERTARAVGAAAGVDEVIAGVLPADKERIVRELCAQGRTAMVGDGVNDAPALTSADLGIAIGAGADVAVDAADAVLVNSKLTDASTALRLGRATLRNIHQNLFWAFFYNVLLIPLAAGVWYPAFGVTVSPMLGAAAMSLSSLFVVCNALRLNLFRRGRAFKKRVRGGNNNDNNVGNDRPNYATNDNTNENTNENANENTNDIQNGNHGADNAPIANLSREDGTMKVTIRIEGMMCAHCEAAVTKALSAVEGVKSVKASSKKGEAVVRSDVELPHDKLTAAVEQAGYKVLGIDSRG